MFEVRIETPYGPRGVSLYRDPKLGRLHLQDGPATQFMDFGEVWDAAQFIARAHLVRTEVYDMFARIAVAWFDELGEIVGPSTKAA